LTAEKMANPWRCPFHQENSRHCWRGTSLREPSASHEDQACTLPWPCDACQRILLGALPQGARRGGGHG